MSIWSHHSEANLIPFHIIDTLKLTETQLNLKNYKNIIIFYKMKMCQKCPAIIKWHKVIKLMYYLVPKLKRVLNMEYIEYERKLTDGYCQIVCCNTLKSYKHDQRKICWAHGKPSTWWPCEELVEQMFDRTKTWR